MIETDKRKAIYLLHQEGMGVRQIARRLQVARNTVRRIIQRQGQMPTNPRKDKRVIDPELLRKLHLQCEGHIQRIHEILTEEHGIQLAYSTLCRMLRDSEISAPHKTRCHRVPDEPGVEMQHDTTIYRLPLAEKSHRVVASLLYLRYSKRRYLKFYTHFNRFSMKCFFHEALMFWGYSAGHCIIDNTNLARLRGIGAKAVIHPEMAAFSEQYFFEFRCHERNHPNRKAGEERSFWTVETNFLPGRSFADLEDLNQQALDWATQRMEQRPQTKARLIPAKVFEHERHYLQALPKQIPAPYRVHQRDTDQYGYVAFDANFYWVPGTRRDCVQILEYAQCLKIYLNRECLVVYPLPARALRNQLFSPPDQPKPRYKPSHRTARSEEEEKRLRAIGSSVGTYLDWVLRLKGIQRHRFLRALLALSRKMTSDLFMQSIQRAHKYQIENIGTIERIAILQMRLADRPVDLVEIDEGFEQREAYQLGALTETPDLSAYKLLDEDPSPDNDHE